MAKIDALAYIVAESTDLTKWQQYAEQVLGMPTAKAPDGGLYLKMDARDFRIAVIPGNEDRYHASGWQVADRAAFDAAISAIESAGITVEAAADATRRARQVEDLAVFTDPSDNRHELSWGYTGGNAAFVSPIGVPSFKAGEYGMGHTVLPAAKKFDATLALFRDTLGFGMSDEFKMQPAPDAPVMRIFFMHCNDRHHSLALGEMPNPAGCIHIMTEVETMSEVGKAYDRMAEYDVKLMATMGEHTNDHMTSFYMMTPGNFALEYGWGGMILDPASHETTHTESVSVWGHDFSVGFE